MAGEALCGLLNRATFQQFPELFEQQVVVNRRGFVIVDRLTVRQTEVALVTVIGILIYQGDEMIHGGGSAGEVVTDNKAALLWLFSANENTSACGKNTDVCGQIVFQ